MKALVVSLVLAAAVVFTIGCKTSIDTKSYEVVRCDVDDDFTKAVMQIRTPKHYTDSELVKIASKLHQSTIASDAYTISFFTSGEGETKPYQSIYYRENCKSCEFNAKDYYGAQIYIQNPMDPDSAADGTMN